MGRWLLTHLLRLGEQAGFAGRVVRLGLRRPGRRRELMFRLILEETLKLLKGALPLTLTTGFIMGAAWAFIWLGPLASLGGGLDNLSSSLVAVNALLLAPSMVSVIVIFGYGAAVVWDLAIMKSSRQMETLVRLGIPPEHFLAAPRLGAMTLVMPGLLSLFVLVSFAGAYLVIWNLTGHSALAFIVSLNENSRAVHFAALLLKSLAISLSISFFCVYGGFETPVGSLGSELLSQALAEAFFFSILTSLLVSAVFR